MAVQQEIKSQLAKLLATEDIVVEHKYCETAQFNVQTRVLTLPMWEKASNYVYDMLVGHEVGHALFTPNVDPPKDVPHQFMNVCEDARIEKLMKRKYLGIAKSFFRGYSEMHEEDFFEIDGKDISNFNLADRANLYFKIGSFTDIPFSAPEKEIISLIYNAETFTETIAAAKALYNFCQQETQQKEQEQISPATEGIQSELFKQPTPDSDSDTGDSDTDSTGDIDSSLPNSNSDAPVESGIGDTDSDTRSRNSNAPIEPEVQTADSLMGKLKDLTDNATSENVYVEIPQVNLESVIVPNKRIHEICDNHFIDASLKYDAASKERGAVPEDLKYLYPDTTFEHPDSEYAKFKKDAQKEVSYLVKEFECRKSASAYARAATSRTGILDTRNLHTYKFNEDLFKKVTILPDGKNHGLIFILDWSGSMGEVLLDTIKQLYNLIWFCKKVSIPFDVYAFTNEYPHHAMEEDRHGNYVRSLAYTAKSGLAAVGEHFSLMNFFSSDVKAKDLDNQLLNIWRIAYAHRGYGSRLYDIPLGMHLSGTPLNEAMVCLHEIIPQFKNKNGVEKVQCVVLTDGEAHPLCYHREVHRPWEDEPYMGVNQLGYDSYLRNRKTGNTYNFNGHWYTFTRVLLRDLKDSFPDTNFIGIRILANRDAGSFIRTYSSDYEETEKLTKSWKKNKSFSLRCAGYDTYFGLSSAALDNDTDFEVKEDATKAQIRSAFKKSLNSKKMNKKILGEFVELVA